MGQSRPIRKNASPGHADPATSRAALGWAEIAGLVEIHANGSWSLTEVALRQLRQRFDIGRADDPIDDTHEDIFGARLGWPGGPAHRG